MHNELSGSVSGPVVMGASIGSVNFHAAPSERVVPRQLPPMGAFVNRAIELDAIDRAVATAQGSAPVVVLWGPGGVGKSALALRWLHANQERFADGVLNIDLGGGTGTALGPAEALAMLLRGLGVAAEVLPASLQERIGLYLSLLATRHMAVLLENAVTAAQVRPLLSAVPSTVVLVTSRSQLTGLRIDSAPAYVAVEPLDEEAAIGMLRQLVGAERLDRERPAAERLAELCGRFPLVLSIAGARLAGRTRWSVAAAAEELLDESRRLAWLVVPGDDRSVGRALDVSYGRLPADAALMYRTMGLHPTPEFALPVAVAATGLSDAAAEAAVEHLVEQSLLVEVDMRRYRFHDVLWLDAAARAAALDRPADRDAAIVRLVDWYTRRAVDADLAMTPVRWRVGPLFDGAGTGFPDRATAAEWFQVERANLVGVTAGRRWQLGAAARNRVDEAVWQLGVALWTPFFADRDYESWLATHGAALAAARRLGNDLAVAKLACQRGFAHLGLGDADAAAVDFTAALECAEAVDDAQARSTATESLGLAALQQQRYAEALAWFDRALALAGEVELSRRAVGLLGHHRGRALTGLGRPVEALDELGRALTVMGEIGDRYNEGRVLTSIGVAHRAAGRAEDASRALRAALQIMRTESVFQTAEVAVLLADTSDDPDVVRAALTEARDAYATLHAPQTAEIDRRLAAKPA